MNYIKITFNKTNYHFHVTDKKLTWINNPEMSLETANSVIDCLNRYITSKLGITGK